jgi:cation:H+ antiporter
VLNEVGRFSTLAALLGILCSGLLLAGLLERRHRMVWRMGFDSLAVLGAYAAGLFMLYRLR